MSHATPRLTRGLFGYTTATPGPKRRRIFKARGQRVWCEICDQPTPRSAAVGVIAVYNLGTGETSWARPSAWPGNTQAPAWLHTYRLYLCAECAADR